MIETPDQTLAGRHQMCKWHVGDNDAETDGQQQQRLILPGDREIDQNQADYPHENHARGQRPDAHILEKCHAYSSFLSPVLPHRDLFILIATYSTVRPMNTPNMPLMKISIAPCMEVPRWCRPMLLVRKSGPDLRLTLDYPG